MVGYGNDTRSPEAELLVIMLILVSLVIIPAQVNDLAVLIAQRSIYRDPFNPRQHEREAHIIISGSVSDHRRVRGILKELLHPDRSSADTPEFHVVILYPAEPSDGLKDLLYNRFDSSTTYVIGSALSAEDLLKARADIASAILFFCDPQTDSESMGRGMMVEDIGVVLRTLSVNNFNSSLECLVQVGMSEEREMMKSR